GRLHRKISRFLAFENTVSVVCCRPKASFSIGTIGDQATSNDEITKGINCGQPVLSKKSDNLLKANLQEWGCRNNHAAIRFSRKLGDVALKRARVAHVDWS